MKKVTLKIESGYFNEERDLQQELSIGRTEMANLVLNDPGLSRINTTIFRDENDVLVVDENSSNGTFLNGTRIGSEPVFLNDGDRLKLGSDTRIEVLIGERAVQPEAFAEKKDEPKHREPAKSSPSENTTKPKAAKRNENRLLLIAAGVSTFAILLLAGIALLLASYFQNKKEKPVVASSAPIPIRVIDPLGGKQQAGLDQLEQYWEVQEKDVTAGDLADTSGTETVGGEAEDFNVSVDYWKQQRARALEPRNAPTGNDPPGTKVPKELYGDGVVKQKAKIKEMQQKGYVIPMDFADLALKRKKGELVELKMATEYWVIEVGGSSNPEPFTTFNFENEQNSPPISAGSNDYNILLDLANNFSGMKYDLLNPADRRQMKIRLLRMFHPNAKPILMRLAQTYHQKFNRPLRVTSLQRSMEYQISLNRTNPNSFKVRGTGSLPPHTSGCAFDLGRKNMTAEEQNFLMEELAQMERDGKLDALREGNLNACFHIFIYDDGVPPSGY
ncbi:MAG: DUF5715 family protein [Pyrinomonadaceae bacterium]